MNLKLMENDWMERATLFYTPGSSIEYGTRRFRDGKRNVAATRTALRVSDEGQRERKRYNYSDRNPIQG